jgi:hypothetical protein
MSIQVDIRDNPGDSIDTLSPLQVEMDPISDTTRNSGEVRKLVDHGQALLPGVPPNHSKGVVGRLWKSRHRGPGANAGLVVEYAEEELAPDYLIDRGLHSLPLRPLALMLEYQACPAPYRPGPGDEDHRRHSAKANSYFYTVCLGFMRGIYTDE